MTEVASGATACERARDAAQAGNSAAAPVLLQVSELRHSFGEVRVLDGLSFDLRAGEILGLLGPNGCGKSTTLRVLTGMLVPDGGQLRLSGEPLPPGGRALRARMGVVFQSPSLDQRLSARENLQLSAQLQRVPRADIPRRVAQALELAQLTARAGDRVLDLSGGMRRRLELSRALLHEPDLLVMDEPTTGLDETSFRRTWERIAQLREGGRLTVLLSTHRAEEAALCDRVAIIDHGRVVALDTPSALIDRVAGDVLTLEANEPESLAREISERFSVAARVTAGKIVIERERGHELVPRLVEALPDGAIRTLSMHRPTLADVFVKLTGRALADETNARSDS